MNENTKPSSPYSALQGSPPSFGGQEAHGRAEPLEAIALELADALRSRDAVITEIAHMRTPSSAQVERLEVANERVDALTLSVAGARAQTLAELRTKLEAYRLIEEVLGGEDRRATKVVQSILRELEAILAPDRTAGEGLRVQQQNGGGMTIPKFRFLSRTDSLLGRGVSRRSQA